MGITWVIKCRGTRKEKRFPWGIFQGLLLAVWDSVCWLTAQEKRSATWASPTHPVSLSVSATHTHNTLCKISWAAPFSFQVTAADRTRQSQGIPLLSLFSGDVYFFFQYNKSPSSFCPVSSSPALTISTFPLCSLMFLRSLSTTNSTDMLPIHPSFIILLLRLAVYLPTQSPPTFLSNSPTRPQNSVLAKWRYLMCHIHREKNVQRMQGADFFCIYLQQETMQRLPQSDFDCKELVSVACLRILDMIWWMHLNEGMEAWASNFTLKILIKGRLTEKNCLQFEKWKAAEL